jgi:alpha-N-arabinofuranosidase
MNAFNTFESPDTVKPVPFDGATLDGNHLKITLPAMSVIALTLT